MVGGKKPPTSMAVQDFQIPIELLVREDAGTVVGYGWIGSAKAERWILSTDPSPKLMGNDCLKLPSGKLSHNY